MAKYTVYANAVWNDVEADSESEAIENAPDELPELSGFEAVKDGEL